MPASQGQIRFSASDGRSPTYQVEKTQFSIYGERSDGAWKLVLRHALYFRGKAPHDIGSPPEERGPLLAFDRPIPLDEAEPQKAVQTLAVTAARFSSPDIPYPAGISFGVHHLGVREMTYGATVLDDLRFLCQAAGSLRAIGEDPQGLDGAHFELAVELPFEGVWLESSDPADEPELERLFAERFDGLGLNKEIDRFTDAVVLRGSR